MKAGGKIGLGLAVLCISGQVWAQVPPPGYQVSWGTQSVPLSPWLSAVMVLMLVLATYLFMRRRSGRGVMLLVGGLAVGGLVLHTETDVIGNGYDFTITTPAGSTTLLCGPTQWLGTTVPGGVTLTVTPLASVPGAAQGAAATPSLVLPSDQECTTGLHLIPGNSCYVCPNS